MEEELYFQKTLQILLLSPPHAIGVYIIGSLFPAQQCAEHASGESHETAQAEQIADKRGDKRRTHAIRRAEQHRAYDVHHMLHRRALAAEHGKGKQTSHDCNGAEYARRRKLFGIDFFHFYFSFEISRRELKPYRF